MRAAAGLLFLSLAALAPPAGACATAYPRGAVAEIAEESALIVWDAAAHREHFIRRAAFRAKAKDFGFLVPTPAKPELAEVSDAVFASLERITQPEVVYEREWGVEPTLSCGLMFLRGAAKSAAVAGAPVRVLDTQRVAGFDAVVLEADSAGALAQWLKDHGYDQRPELSAWLEPYVAAKWKLTAFKIATGEAAAPETSAVRMSFAADRPFFPYREPSDARENRPASAPSGDRLLRVFFAGTERVDGTIGAAAAPWPGRAVWSGRVPAAALDFLPNGVSPGIDWLTMFEDRASPRPGTDDLYFAPGRDRGPVKPPPLVEKIPDKIPLPLDIVLGGGLLCSYLWRRVRRKPSTG
jgi:hypothetical protein